MSVSHPIARTAFYCCVIRADDALLPRPVCGDQLAARFLDDDIRRDLQPAVRFKAPARSNVVRHRMIDDIVRETLASDPHRRIILLGAGFDTRAFRLSGGRWVEVDDEQLLAFKETRLPAAEAPNPLVRTPVLFDRVDPDALLAPLAGDDDAIVVLEGVSMYLSDAALATFAAALARQLPHATLVCDLMTPRFARTFSRNLQQALLALGARFGDRQVQPETLLMDAGWQPVSRTSIPGRTAELGSIAIPAWVLATVLRGLRDGYVLWTFRRA